MKIIVGLGNPGLKYAGTRHNTGFSALIGISDKFDIPVNKKQCKALVGHGFIADEKVVLAMPQTYMNLSGESVSELLNFYKCTPDDLIVLYDDVDLDVGVIRLRGKGSAGGHNGIKSIIELIGTDTFDRVKIGVGHKPEDWDLADHVLARFSPEDRKTMQDSIERSVLAVEELIKNGLDSAMNKYN